LIVLLDTGPWVALLDKSESRHNECTAWLKNFEGDILSTEAVLTEVLYLLDFSLAAQQGALDFVLTGAVTLVPSSLKSLETAKGLLAKYSDLPMDFADATLVALANELNVGHIATLDQKDFSIYRFGKNKSFTILP
jgi:predicted nucleic acid-binding protein